MTDLVRLKKAAIDAEAAWQDAREKALRELRSDEVLVDCSFCHQVFVARNVPLRQLWFCPCSPRGGQKAIPSRRR